LPKISKEFIGGGCSSRIPVIEGEYRSQGHTKAAKNKVVARLLKEKKSVAEEAKYKHKPIAKPWWSSGGV
jgi:hypothetical protein